MTWKRTVDERKAGRSHILGCVDDPAPAVTEVRLRRGPLCRLASSNTQAWLSMLCLATLAGVGYGLADGRPVFGGSLLTWLPALIYFVPWLAGVTAWARADDDGLRWRYWTRTELRWENIRRIELTNREFVLPESGGRTRAIVVIAKPEPGEPDDTGVQDSIRPAESAGRNLRRFGAEVAALAGRHGVHVVVASRGWDEPLEGPSEENWS